MDYMYFMGLYGFLAMDLYGIRTIVFSYGFYGILWSITMVLIGDISIVFMDVDLWVYNQYESG